MEAANEPAINPHAFSAPRRRRGAAVAGLSAARAQTYAINWWTMDGGGGTSTGGGYSVSGTIGPPAPLPSSHRWPLWKRPLSSGTHFRPFRFRNSNPTEVL
jgi:hypothetical protein